MISIFFVSILLALILAPIGCFILWKDYVFLADSISHASLLAVIINAVFALSITESLIISSLIFTSIIFLMKINYDNNASIAFVTSATIAFSLAVSDILPDKIQLVKLIKGDITNVTCDNIITLSILLCILSLFLFYNFRGLILMVINRELAYSKGVKIVLLDFCFLLIMSITILITLKIVGILLIISLFLIPVMNAKMLAKSPQQMIYYSIISSILMSILGLLIYNFGHISFAPATTLSGCLIHLMLRLYRL